MKDTIKGLIGMSKSTLKNTLKSTPIPLFLSYYILCSKITMTLYMVETIRYEKTYFRGVYKGDIGVLKKDAQKRNFSYFRKLYRGSIKGVMKGDRKSNLKEHLKRDSP